MSISEWYALELVVTVIVVASMFLTYKLKEEK